MEEMFSDINRTCIVTQVTPEFLENLGMLLHFLPSKEW